MKSNNLLYQKHKYAYCTLSSDSVLYRWLDLARNWDYVAFSYEMNILDSVFSSFVESVLLDVLPTELAPWQVDYDYTYGSIDDWLSGSFVDFSWEDLSVEFPELTEWSFLFSNTFELDFAQNILEFKLEKGVYGKSKFYLSYYDPVAARNFLKSTLIAMTKRKGTDQTIVQRVVAAAKAFDVQTEVARCVFNGLQAASITKFNFAMFDYVWFDVSSYPEEKSEPHLVFVDWDLKERSVEVHSFADILTMPWLDLFVIDCSHVISDELPLAYIEERAGNLLTEAATNLAESAKRRIFASSLALANYQTPSELADPTRSVRVEGYHLPRHLMECARDSALRIAEAHGLPPVQANLYAAAVTNLLRFVSRPGGWGEAAFKVATAEEIREFFIERWVSAGLKREILEEIFDYLEESGMLMSYPSMRKKTRESIRAYRGGGRK